MPLMSQQATVRKIAVRLLPFLFLLYIVAFLDRVNVSFAGLDMTRDLNFSDRVFGLGAGIFFIGYVVFEIPGALLVERWSARKVIARILVTWGIVTVQWRWCVRRGSSMRRDFCWARQKPGSFLEFWFI